MKREARLLLRKACDSLVLSVEFFNRPHELGRVSASLILLDHAFEMLLKACILHRGGRIRDRNARETIGFDACVRRGLSDGNIKFLSEEQALLLQTINGLRDAAQHHLLEISENQLYLHAQAGLTLFRDLLKSVFGKDIREFLPTRVLPISASPPTDVAALFDSEVAEIRKLLQPGRRRRVEAEARLRPLAILDAAVRGEKTQPSSAELHKIGRRLRAGENWQDVFVGAAAIEVSPEGTGPTISLRLSKKEGIPIQLVPEGTPGASVVAVRRVNELDFYNLGAKQMAEKLGLSTTKLVAVVDYLGIRGDPDFYKEFRFGSQLHKRYSQKALERIRTALEEQSAEEIWAKYRAKRTAKAKAG